MSNLLNFLGIDINEIVNISTMSKEEIINELVELKKLSFMNEIGTKDEMRTMMLLNAVSDTHQTGEDFINFRNDIDTKAIKSFCSAGSNPCECEKEMHALIEEHRDPEIEAVLIKAMTKLNEDTPEKTGVHFKD